MNQTLQQQSMSLALIPYLLNFILMLYSLNLSPIQFLKNLKLELQWAKLKQEQIPLWKLEKLCQDSQVLAKYQHFLLIFCHFIGFTQLLHHFNFNFHHQLAQLFIGLLLMKNKWPHLLQSLKIQLILYLQFYQMNPLHFLRCPTQTIFPTLNLLKPVNLTTQVRQDYIFFTFILLLLYENLIQWLFSQKQLYHDLSKVCQNVVSALQLWYIPYSYKHCWFQGEQVEYNFECQ